MPAVEALLPRFRAAHTQVLGVSIDSVYSHANWARSLGGISFPLLADFEPKGAVATSMGVYLEGAGITDRATVMIDSSGVVRHASSVTPAGVRDIEELAALCEKIDRETTSPTAEDSPAGSLDPGAVLYVKEKCGFSTATLLARDNLHLSDQLPVRNVTIDAAARNELEQATGSDQSPCLIFPASDPIQDSGAIIEFLVAQVEPSL